MTERAIQTWEGGISYPKVGSLKRFIELRVQYQAFAMSREEEEIQVLWKTARQKVLLDEFQLHKLLSSPPLKAILPSTRITTGPGPASSMASPIVSAPVAVFPRIDWIRALDVSTSELVAGKVEALRHYALEQAQAKDYVREIQIRLLVRPLLERLRAELEQDRLIEEHLLRLLDRFRAEEDTVQGYGPANVISVLKELRGDLRELNLSQL